MEVATLTSIFNGCINSGYKTVRMLELMAETPFRFLDLSMGDVGPETQNMGAAELHGWVETVRETAQRFGMSFVQAHSTDSKFDSGAERDSCDNEIRRQIGICGLLGIPQMVVHSLFKQGNTWKQQRNANKDFYSSLLGTAEKKQVTILVENSCYQNCRGMYYSVSAEHLLTTIDDLGGHPLMGICWDVGHANMQGCDQYSEIVEMGNRLKGVHIHDNNGNMDNHLMPFMGNCGYDAILKGLRDNGYQGFFTLEVFPLPSATFVFVHRKGCNAKGKCEEKLVDLPYGLVVQAVTLMHGIAKHMVSQYE